MLLEITIVLVLIFATILGFYYLFQISTLKRDEKVTIIIFNIIVLIALFLYFT